DTPAAVTASFDRPLLAIRVAERYKALRSLEGYQHTGSVFPFGETLHYTDRRIGRAPEAIAADLTAHLRASGFDRAEVFATSPTIEDVFMARMAASRGALDGTQAA